METEMTEATAVAAIAIFIIGLKKRLRMSVSSWRARKEETLMRNRFLSPMMKIAIAATAVASVISVSITRISAQAPAAHAVLKTSWGDPDLQGIWTDETATPLQRSPKYANQEFFTQGQRAELDAARAAMLGRDKRVE